MRKILWLCCLFIAINLSATTIPITGTLRTPSGALVNGQVKFFLPFAGVQDDAGAAVSPGPVVWPVFNGKLPSYARLTANGTSASPVMTPAGTFYIVTVSPFYGASWTFNVLIPNAGSFDLGSAAQVNITTLNLSLVNPPSLSANNTWTGTQSFAAAMTVNGAFVATNTAGFGGRVTFSSGISNSGAGMQHKRVASCTTAAPTFSVCDTTVTWNQAFADVNYTVECQLSASGNDWYVTDVSVKTAASIHVQIINGASGVAASGVIECLAVHD